MFRVQAHVFKTEGSDTGLAGRCTFTTHDYKMAKAFANGMQFDEGYQANVDFERRVNIGRRTVWVDCNAHCLDRAAEVLMRAADDIRMAEHNNGVKQAAE